MRILLKNSAFVRVQVVEVDGSEYDWNPSKQVKAGLDPNAEIKTVLVALSQLAGDEHQGQVQKWIQENDSLTGHLAEIKTQLTEVLRPSYISERVAEETCTLRHEQEAWNEKNMAKKREIDLLTAEIDELDAGEHRNPPLLAPIEQ